jgi:hypothetical protein
MDCWYDFVGTRNAVVETTVVPSAFHLYHPLRPSWGQLKSCSKKKRAKKVEEKKEDPKGGQLLRNLPVASYTSAARLFLLCSNLGLEIFSPRLQFYVFILT